MKVEAFLLNRATPFILLCLMAVLTPTEAHRSSYGDSCNKTHRCDRRAYLACQPDICGCLKPDEMVFETSTQRCGIKTGEQCKYMIEMSDGQIASEIQNCVEDAICDADGFCSCREYFTETENGTCTPSLKQQYAEPCGEKLKCSTGFGLLCNEGRCQCDTQSLFSMAHDHCVGQPGAQCIQSGCTSDAKCTDNNICKCTDGYYRKFAPELPLLSCEKQHERLEPCKLDTECESVLPSLKLTCVNQVCECNPDTSLFGTIQTFSEDKQAVETASQCLGKEGHPCILGHCASGNICSHDVENVTGICVCQPGYSPSGTGKCAIGCGGKCDSPDTCHQGLVCKDGTCSCRYSDKQAYSEVKGKCISLAGAPCTDQSTCTDYAACEHRRNICKCLPEYVNSAEGTCELRHGMSCNGSVSCDSVADLVCVNGSCECDTFSEYSDEFRKCLKYVGYECRIASSQDECNVPGRKRAPVHFNHPDMETSCLELTSNWKRECVVGAYCKPINEKLQGICECKLGFRETAALTCTKDNSQRSVYFG